jgi:hypothetical protein
MTRPSAHDVAALESIILDRAAETITPIRAPSHHHDLQGTETLNIKHDGDAIDCRIQ